MNPSQKRQSVLVGIFVSVAVLILAGGILMIGSLNDTFTQKIIVSALFNEVGGLQKGDNIWFSGLKVGIVKSVGFHGESLVLVELRVDIEAAPYIPSDVLAKVGSDGLIGNRIVVLYGGTPEAPKLKEGDVIVVGETVSTDEMMDTLQKNNTNLLAITGDLKEISRGIVAGEGSLGKLLKEDGLHETVTEAAAKLNTASSNAERLTASLSTFTAKLNQPGHLPNDLVTDDTTWASLTETVQQLKAVSERTSALVDGLAERAADPKTPLGTLISDEEAGADLKVTLENLNKSSAALNKDLEALEHSFLLRRAFRAKARADAKAAEE